MEFNNSQGELFGRYALIPVRGYDVEKFMYKVIGSLESNGYCDVPLSYDSKLTVHKESVPVVNVVCCGVAEDAVVRVALADVELIGEKQKQKMTNFEKWKAGLTSNALYRLVDATESCIYCPANGQYCEDRPDNDCVKTIEDWAKEDAQDD